MPLLRTAAWDVIAPKLAELGAYVVGADLPGHGHSGHRSAAAYYSSAEYAANVVELWTALRWDRGVLLGHSLGAGLACVAAAALPDAVQAVLLVDGLGPYPRPIEETVALFQRAIEAKAGFLRAPRSVYPSVEVATSHRVSTVSRHPGRQYLSVDAARRLVERALEPAPATAAAGGGSSSAGAAPYSAALTDSPSSPPAGTPSGVACSASGAAVGVSGGRDSCATSSAAAAGKTAQSAPHCAAGAIGGLGAAASPAGSSAAAEAIGASGALAAPGSAPVPAGWCFRHDPKIKGPSLQYFTEEQALQFLAAIRCPVLHITAVDGWPRPAEVVERRMRAVRDLENHTLPGSHHLHLDADTAPAVIDACAAFLRKRVGGLA